MATRLINKVWKVLRFIGSTMSSPFECHFILIDLEDDADRNRIGEIVLRGDNT